MARRLTAFAVCMLMTGPALAQSAQTGSHNPPMKDGAPHTIASPAKGANSFTEDQAKGRFEKAGYSQIKSLKKADGLWHASAVKDGKTHMVMLDYKGNITNK